MLRIAVRNIGPLASPLLFVCHFQPQPARSTSGISLTRPPRKPCFRRSQSTSPPGRRSSPAKASHSSRCPPRRLTPWFETPTAASWKVASSRSAWPDQELTSPPLTKINLGSKKQRIKLDLPDRLSDTTTASRDLTDPIEIGTRETGPKKIDRRKTGRKVTDHKEIDHEEIGLREIGLTAIDPTAIVLKAIGPIGIDLRETVLTTDRLPIDPMGTDRPRIDLTGTAAATDRPIDATTDRDPATPRIDRRVPMATETPAALPSGETIARTALPIKTVTGEKARPATDRPTTEGPADDRHTVSGQIIVRTTTVPAVMATGPTTMVLVPTGQTVPPTVAVTIDRTARPMIAVPTEARLTHREAIDQGLKNRPRATPQPGTVLKLPESGPRKPGKRKATHPASSSLKAPREARSRSVPASRLTASQGLGLRTVSERTNPSPDWAAHMPH
jgi:hypothetical protein